MLNFYKKNGYLLVKNAIENSLINQINKEIEVLFKNKNKFELFNKNFDLYRNTANISQYLISMYKLITHKKILNSIKKLGIELPILNTRPVVSYSSKKIAKNEMYWKIPAHQDWPSMQGSINSLTAWIPLINLNKSIGYMEVIPTSHLNGALKQKNSILLNDNEYNEKDFIQIKMNKGDVLFFSAFLIHRSGNNISDKIRLATHIRYDDGNEKSFIKRQYPHHRIDKTAEGILFPDLNTKKIIKNIFK